MKNCFEVDFVVLWVDGSDPEFVSVRNAWAARLGRGVPAGARFVQSDELRYVLRGVDRFLPWVTRVVLVTNGQRPAWLNSCHPRLKILTHREFLPTDALPTFNSCAIAAGLMRWQGLAEHFLLANDDTFIFRPLPRSYFFPRETCAVNYFSCYPDKDYTCSEYGRQLLLLRRRLQNKFPNTDFPLEPHHNISGYVRSACLTARSLFEAEFSATECSHFRQTDNCNCYLFAGVSAVLGKAVWRPTRKSRWFGSDGMVWELWQDYAREIQKYRPRLVCLNDSDRSSMQDRERLNNYLQRTFPWKSSFEI